ncbi:MAG: bifunctional DNA-binding transcriptional regulator/O6-methylguanine-DNA methyltransferase Ada [Desulfobacteraceae bacterium]|nr:MAG: bifunctional DNA-binding transcriptional regulator/O6-methylguanine-DNA methyltransferase Ada [Desulfobacteraceae bacterium]
MQEQAENRYSTEQARWDAIVRKDRRAGGAFVYGVLSTFVFCRPGCSSRLPKHENVRFFDTWEEAEQAGFRPCRRCAPKASGGQKKLPGAIVRACRLIEESGETLSLRELADAAGLSPFHFQRLFKGVLGVTPKQYAMENRLKRVRSGLKKGTSVTDAVYDAGFSSSSRFYENIDSVLGMKPAEYRKGADGLSIRFTVAKTPLGWLLIAATVKGICTIEFGETPQVLEARLRKRFPGAEFRGGDEDFISWVTRVLTYIESPRGALDLPLDIQGTAFQRRVWMALREIPPGSTASYAEIADRIGSPGGARAVAQACAANPVPIAVPCHRVIRRNGDPGGYRYGVERKRRLLAREKSGSSS